MAKGMFSQGVCLLSDGSTEIEHVKQALEDNQLEVLKQNLPGTNPWFGGNSLIIAYRPEINGYLSIDLLNNSWPDHMGNPKTEPDLFGAWSMGRFGPQTSGGLERAGQHSWDWREGAAIAAQHRSIIRLRLSYVLGTNRDAPVLPKDYDPIDELMFLNRVVVAIGDAPGVLCYFNPNGEMPCTTSPGSRPIPKARIERTNCLFCSGQMSAISTSTPRTRSWTLSATHNSTSPTSKPFSLATGTNPLVSDTTCEKSPTICSKPTAS